MPDGPKLLKYESVKDRPRWGQKLLAFWRAIPIPVVAMALFIAIGAMYVNESFHDLFFPRGANWSREALPPFFFGVFFMAPAFAAFALRSARWSLMLPAPLFLLLAAFLPDLASKAVPGGLHVYLWLARGGVATLVLGVFAWVACEDRTRSTFLWMLAGVAGAAAFEAIAVNLVCFFDTRNLEPTLWQKVTWYIDGECVWRAGLWTLAACGAISWGLQAARGRRRSRLVFGGAMLTTVAAYTLVFGPLIVPLARLSMRDCGPFEKTHAAWIIEQAGTAQDTDCLYEALDKCGWAIKASGNWNNSSTSDSAWQDAAFHAITVRDPVRAADRLCSRILAAPDPRLAEAAAPLFAAQHRYETVPILLRYVLFERMEFRRVSATSAKALEDMGIPHVAVAIMIDFGVSHMHSAELIAGPVSVGIQQRLNRLLRVDGGDNLERWEGLYWRTIESAPSPLPAELHKEADAIVDSFMKYQRAKIQLSQASRTGPLPRVSLPNFNAPTTQQFLREIDAYLERVKKAIADSPPNPSDSSQPGGKK